VVHADLLEEGDPLAGAFEQRELLGADIDRALAIAPDGDGPELWLASDTLPAGEIQIVCVYKDVKMSIDSASHVTYDGDTIGGLKKFLFLVDGKEYAINDLEQLSVPIEKMAAEIYEQAQALDFESKKKLYFTQKAYSYKHLCSALGQDWQPDQEIFQEVAGRELYKISWPEEKQEQMDLIKKNLDPRIDFRV
jgi:hypothetical protein